jgi:hypothetical protein
MKTSNKWIIAIIVLVVLIAIALIITFAQKNAHNKNKTITQVPAWLIKSVHSTNAANAADAADATTAPAAARENYINFNIGTVSDFGEARAIKESNTINILTKPRVFSKANTINKLDYIHNYENTIAVSNTRQIYNSTITGSPHGGKYINLNSISNRPLISFGLILEPGTSVYFYVDEHSTFPFFQLEGALTISINSQSKSVPLDDTGIYNIVGQDIHQKFILAGFMSVVTFLFLGNLVCIENQSINRFYGLVFAKSIPKERQEPMQIIPYGQS